MKTITIDDNHAILDLMRHIMHKTDPNGKHFFADNAAEGLEMMESEGIRIIFLDIEMPGMSGEEAANRLIERYGRIDLIFITGHTEYAMLGHRLHCTAFVTKPFDEEDIAEALEYLRLPVTSDKVLKVRCSGNFTVTANGKPIHFERSLTTELLAYLVYKNGAFATNGEIIGILWDGAPDKQDYLRKHVKDLRDRFTEAGAPDVLFKNRGSIALNMSEIDVDGNPAAQAQEFQWL